VKLRGVGFVKEVGFKPGVKERWSYRCTKWCDSAVYVQMIVFCRSEFTQDVA